MTVLNDSVYTYDDYGNVIKTEQGFVTRTVKKTYEVVSESVDTSQTHMSTSTEYDSTGNYAVIETDGAGRTTTLAYGTENDEEVLTTVTKPDGSTISIDYLLTDDDYNVIDSITSSDGTKMSFEYDDLSLPMAKAFCKKAHLKNPKSATVSFTWG